MVKHYFFRFGTKNHFIKKFYNEEKSFLYRDEYSELSENCHVLAIYYDNFTTKDIKNLIESSINSGNIESKHKSGVVEFYSTKENSIFWVFLDSHILSFEQISSVPFEFEHDLYNDKFTYKKKNYNIIAKCKKFKAPKIFLRSEIPEIFSTTDSSGIYGTIQELSEDGMKKENLDIARALIKSERIVLPNIESAIRYLSPIQLETLLFKYFNDNGFMVTSHRGGARFRIDIEVLENESLLPLPAFNTKERVKIQVKRIFDDPNEILKYLKQNIYFFTLSDITDSSIVDNPFFIGPHRINQIFNDNDERAKSTVQWVKAVLGNKIFSYDF